MRFAVLVIVALLTALFPGPASLAAQSVPGPVIPAAFDCSTVVGIPISECQALVALYEATHGPIWSNVTGWLGTDTPCNWYGVTCYGSNVGALSLAGNKLQGNLPPEIGNLFYLRFLLLSSNPLDGPLPLSLTNVPYMDTLHFDGTTLCEPGDAGFQIWLQGVWAVKSTALACPLPGALAIGGPASAFVEAGHRYTANISSGSIMAPITYTWQITGQPEIVHASRPEVIDSVEVTWTLPGPQTITVRAEGPARTITTSRNVTATSGCPTVTGIPPSECRALVALYRATNGRAWNYTSRWLETSAPCGWYGIQCSGGQVTLLGLYYNNLTGTIPPQLADLTGLQRLDFYHNNLSGSIPSALGSLATLQTLYVSFNQLTGPIPAEFGNMTSLQLLGAWNNRLSGSIPPELGRLRNLAELRLYNNKLTGGIPVELANIASLQSIELSNNQLTGTVPYQLSNLPKLAGLSVGNNPLAGPLPQSLTNLHLTAFAFDQTALCEPSNAAFQSWLTTIPYLSRTGIACKALHLPLVNR
jgi:hypothetical protein